jgi:predicted HTH transcriptional regulator
LVWTFYKEEEIFLVLDGLLYVLSPTTPEIIDQIHELILEDRRISAKSIAEQLGTSHERVGSIIHEDLDMLVACFLPGRAKDLSALLYTD